MKENPQSDNQGQFLPTPAKFSRAERLKSSKQIAALFQGRQSFARYPLRIIWMEVSGDGSAAPVQFALSVPKKKFPKATARNRIRRLVRESWRLQKSRLLDISATKSSTLLVMVLYTATEELPFRQIELAMGLAVQTLSKKWR